MLALSTRLARSSTVPTMRGTVKLLPLSPPATVHRRALASTAAARKPQLDAGTAAGGDTPPPGLANAGAAPKPKTRPSQGIGEIFASLGTDPGAEAAALPPRYAALKRALVRDAAHGAQLQAAWRSVLAALRTQVKRTRELGGSAIPVVEYAPPPRSSGSDASGASAQAGQPWPWLTASAIASIRARGVALVRGVVPRELALGWKESIRAYAKANPQTTGFPEHDPQVLELYWSKAQVQARAHPAVLDVSRAFLSLFHQSSPSPSSPSSSPTDLDVHSAAALSVPLTYADRLRIRHPGDASFALGAHIDGGGIERWEDAAFRAVYRHVLDAPAPAEGAPAEGSSEGDAGAEAWRQHDAFDLGSLGERLCARTSLYGGGKGQCSVFRPWQGWLSMSDTTAGEGTLQVLPFLKEASAYIMLRPLFRAVDEGKEGEEMLREDNWVMDLSTPTFPGATLGHNLELTSLTHPHLGLPSTMVSLPRAEPGDMVLWHCDLVHGVERQHGAPRGSGRDSSVLYIPAIPLTAANAAYVARGQREALRRGSPPKDFFPDAEGETAFEGRATHDDVHGREARRAMALECFDTESARDERERRLLEHCNQIFAQAP